MRCSRQWHARCCLMRSIMGRRVALLLLLLAAACGSTAQPGLDGGGGLGGGGTGGGGSGGGAGTGGAAGGRAGNGGAGGCAPNQVWCPGCEPGTGACYVGGCPGAACPPPDAGVPPAQLCHGGASCSAGTSCGLDCMGNVGNVSGLTGPGINCSCANGAYSCRVVWEGTAGLSPGLCSTSAPQGTSCSSRCNLCRVSAVPNSGDCFCSADLVWVCS